MKHVLPIYQVDAFTNTAFKGNPAAVCILDEKITERIMQSIATEMNLSETAFLLQIGVEDAYYSLRWFTPKNEVPLCGHATLASAAVLFNEMDVKTDEIRFDTKSGILKAKKSGRGVVLDFPADEPLEVDTAFLLPVLNAMGVEQCRKAFVGKTTGKYLVHLDDPDTIFRLEPNFAEMQRIAPGLKGIGVTARAKDKYDFISRYFNPWFGVDEDPVTGSIHTILTPYWAEIFGKKELYAYQASARGGEMHLNFREDKCVEMIGQTVILLKGQLFLADEIL